MYSDVMPNSGDAFPLSIPEERKRKESADREQANVYGGVLEEILAFIDQQFEEAGSISSLNLQPETSERSLKVQVLAARWRQSDLLDLRAKVASIIDASNAVNEGASDVE